YLSGKAVYNSTETLARLQENARFAATAIEDDLKHAGLYGVTASFANIVGTAANTPIAAASGDCAPLWYLQLQFAIEAYDGNVFSGSCLSDPDYVSGTDVFAVRRTDTNAVVGPENGQVLLRSVVGRG